MSLVGSEKKEISAVVEEKSSNQTRVADNGESNNDSNDLNDESSGTDSLIRRTKNALVSSSSSAAVAVEPNGTSVGKKRRSGGMDEEKAGLMTSIDQESNNNNDYDDHNDIALVTSTDDDDDDDEESECITVEQAVDRLGSGPFQIKILIASGLCFAADAMQVLLLSFLTLVLKDEWALSNSKTESITPCLFAGSLVGTMILGPAADSYGRRPIFLTSASIISLFGFLTALSDNYWLFLFLLFGVGFGVGGLVVPFDLLAEFLPSAGRGRILLSIEYFWSIGCLYVVVIAYVTLHGTKNLFHGTENLAVDTEWSSSGDESSLNNMPFDADWNGDELMMASPRQQQGHHWRTFVALCTVPCVVSLIIGYFCVPESALWLAAEGRSEEALDILRNAAIANGHEDPYLLFPSTLRLQRDQSHKDASFAELFTPEWREITFRLWGTWGGFAFGYYGALLAITKVFEKDDGTTKGDDYDFDYSAIFLSSSAELVGTTMVIILVDRVGRISSQVGCYIMAGICVCALCVLDAWDYPRIFLVVIGFAARVFEMGGSCTTWVSTAEILTTEVRSTGHSTANAMARLGAFFCPFLVEGTMPLVGIGVFMFFVHLFTAFCASKLPETKGKEMGGGQSRNREIVLDSIDTIVYEEASTIVD